MNNIIAMTNIVGGITFAIIGIVGCIILLIFLFDIFFNKWVEFTRKTVWFFDYIQNRRKYQLWLNEKLNNGKAGTKSNDIR